MLTWLAVSSLGFIDRVSKEADDNPPCCGRKLDFEIQSGISGMWSMEGKSTTVGGRELSLSDEGSEYVISGGPVGDPRSRDRRCSAEDDGERGILLGSLGSGGAPPRVVRRVGRAV